MSGANMFLMYAASASNVTISPRMGPDHQQPSFNADAQISVLEGTGITGSGQMIANIRCDTCLSWSGGSMDPTDSSSSWIWAIKSGDALDSTSTSANLQQHDTFNTFSLDLTKGTGGSSSNPFVAQQPVSSAAAAPTSAATTAGAPAATASTQTQGSTPTTASAAYPSGYPSGTTPSVSQPTVVSGGSSSGSSSSNSVTTIYDTTRGAHAAIMSAVFLVLFPLFALTLYLPTSKRVRFIHAPLQVFAIVLMIVGLALGVKLAKSVNELDAYHQVIGYILVAVMLGAQPALGIYQHLYYHRSGGHSALGTVHKWLGRSAILVGVVNGGLGFRQSGGPGSAYVPNYAVVVYSVIAVVVFLIYVIVAVTSKWRASRNAPEDEKMGGNAGYEMHPSSGRDERPYISSPQHYPAPPQNYSRQAYR